MGKGALRRQSRPRRKSKRAIHRLATWRPPNSQRPSEVMMMGPGVWEAIDRMVMEKPTMKVSGIVAEKLMRGEFRYIHVDEELGVMGRTVISKVVLNTEEEVSEE